MTAGFFTDASRATRTLAFEFDRRLSDAWSLHAEAIALLSVDEADLHYEMRSEQFRRSGPDLQLLAVIFQQVVHSAPTEETDGAKPTVSRREDRVNIHKNAKLTPQSRADIVRRVVDKG